MKILLVEDNIRKSAAIKRSLEGEHTITEVMTYVDAINAIESSVDTLECIILDMQFPTRLGSRIENNGIKVLSRMRYKNINIPTIVVSGDRAASKLLDEHNLNYINTIYWQAGLSIKDELNEFARNISV